MRIAVRIQSQPIAADMAAVRHAKDGTGAWVTFEGLVRGTEDGRAITALEYEAYAPMAEREIRRILEQLAAEHPCEAAVVIHRTGVVPVGEAAIFVGVSARHRAEAFAVTTRFMDRLKLDVPIWKRRAIPAAELEAALI
jgi:molybdopterin synthase catalytic subunit